MPSLATSKRLSAIPGTPPNMIYPPKGDAFAARNHYAMKIDFERQPPFLKLMIIIMLQPGYYIQMLLKLKIH